MHKLILIAATLFLAVSGWGAEPPAPADRKAILGVATAIEGLKKDYPQLARFKAATHCAPDALRIDYEYKTHAPEGRGGWTSGVPNPDPDGIWFFIDIHSPDSTAQIHTQPMVERLCLGTRRVQFLILEGAQTKKVSGAIRAALTRAGVVRCP